MQAPGVEPRRKAVSRWINATWLALACSVSAQGTPVGEPRTAPISGEPPFRLVRELIAGGGIDRARSACFDLAATISQPVTGTSSGAGFRVTAGFLDELASRDSLLRSSFENCQP